MFDHGIIDGCRTWRRDNWQVRPVSTGTQHEHSTAPFTVMVSTECCLNSTDIISEENSAVASPLGDASRKFAKVSLTCLGTNSNAPGTTTEQRIGLVAAGQNFL